MALLWNTSTAWAIAPISSWRSRSPTVTDRSPAAKRFIRPVIDCMGWEINLVLIKTVVNVLASEITSVTEMMLTLTTCAL